MTSPGRVRVCVVGAGIIGMSSALLVAQSLGGAAEVTLVADQFSPDTTSDVAGGLIMPYKLNDTPLPLIRRWYNVTLQHATDLYNSDGGATAGVMRTTQYFFYTSETPEPYWRDWVYGFQRLTEADLAPWRLQTPSIRAGFTFHSYTLDPRLYCPWLLTRLKENGVKMIKRKLENIKELYSECDVLVACPGVGAVQLLGDTEIKPLKGQAIRVQAPWLKYMYALDDGDCFSVQGVNCVILGARAEGEDGNWNRNVDSQLSKTILTRNESFTPGLKGAQQLEQQVGLRPMRSQVRLEQEDVIHDDRNITVVYNYGHGGSGFGMHWGCAQDVTQLVTEAATRRLATARL